MRLTRMKRAIDKAVEHARKQRRLRVANVEIWDGEKEYEIKEVGQFELLSHVTIGIEEMEPRPIAMEELTSGRVVAKIDKIIQGK